MGTSNKIEFRPQDLVIRETEDGSEVVNIRGTLAFDEGFIEEMKEAGVKKWVQEEEQE